MQCLSYLNGSNFDSVHETMTPAAALMAERTIQKKMKKKRPVIIYLVPPEVIHVDPSEFMALVQRLTGKSTAADSSSTPLCQVKIRESSCSRQFPVRVKARLASSLSRISASHHHHHRQDVQPAAPESKWLVHEGWSQGVAEYAFGSNNFIDIFQ